MESFNFLKFWRTAPVRDIDSDIDSVKKFAHTVGYVGKNPAPTDSTDEEIDKDEDSFFDLVFITGHPKESNSNSVSEKKSSSLKQGKLNSPESPRDVFFTPTPFPIDANPKPNSILRSTPKFSVCFLGFRKSKPEKVGIDDSSTVSPKIQTQKSKVEEGADKGKYLKLMKPLYSRASKRFTEKTQLLSSPSLISPRNSSEEKHGNRVAVLEAVRKRLGKSRSTASSLAGAPMNRRDDSLLEQNDGIQSAILHCKRSYSSARNDCSVLLTRNANGDLPRASSEEQNRWSI